MAKTRAEIRDEVLTRLGDTANLIWSNDEIDDLIRQGYRVFIVSTKLLWGRQWIDDIAGQALYKLPDEVLEVERVTWDDHPLIPKTDCELRAMDGNYERTVGRVEYYSIDSLRRLRKYRIPKKTVNSKGLVVEIIGTWGTPRNLLTIDTQIGSWGIARSIPGYQVIGSWGIPRSGFIIVVVGSWGVPRNLSLIDPVQIGSWGIPRILPGYEVVGSWGVPRGDFAGLSAAPLTAENTRIEYTRRADLPGDSSELEIPNHQAKYIRCYAMSKALGREGPGQDLKLEKHFYSRFLEGVRRCQYRMKR